MDTSLDTLRLNSQEKTGLILEEFLMQAAVEISSNSGDTILGRAHGKPSVGFAILGTDTIITQNSGLVQFMVTGG